MGVLCIQGAFIEHIAMLHRVAEMRAERAKILVVDVRKPSQLPDLDGLIIPGGESTTLSVFLKKNDFEEALKSWMFNEEKPGVVWGTCAGLILLSNDVAGQKQGGQVTVSSHHQIQPSNLFLGHILTNCQGVRGLETAILLLSDCLQHRN